MRIATFVVMANLALAGSVGFAQTVNYDFDRTADFTRFTSYAWVDGTPLSDPLNHERVVNAVESQLAMKGFNKVASGRPDVFVAYHVTFARDVQFTGSSTGWGPYGLGNRSGTIRSQQVLVGTLTLEMVNAATNKVVWRGSASMDIDTKANPEKRERSINKAAEKLFRNYPRPR